MKFIKDMDYVKNMNAQLSTFNERVANALIENKTAINRLKQENKQLKETVCKLTNEMEHLSKLVDSLTDSVNSIEKVLNRC